MELYESRRVYLLRPIRPLSVCVFRTGLSGLMNGGIGWRGFSFASLFSYGADVFDVPASAVNFCLTGCVTWAVCKKHAEVRAFCLCSGALLSLCVREKLLLLRRESVSALTAMTVPALTESTLQV